jgi:hypothetical protein
LLRPATHYQVDLRGTPDLPDQVRLSGLPDEHTHYQVDLLGGPSSRAGIEPATYLLQGIIIFVEDSFPV